MNWYSNVVPPKIKAILKREAPENLWVKCPDSGQLVFHKDIEANLYVVPGSGYHMRCPVSTRLTSLFDNGACELLPTPEAPIDPLKFRDIKRYVDKLKEYRAKTGMIDAVVLATGKLEEAQITVAVQDFDFLGGSLGMAAGEAIVAGADYALTNHTPFIMFTASGGARMQEGMFSLMQMPRTTIAIQRLREAQLPYIYLSAESKGFLQPSITPRENCRQSSMLPGQTVKAPPSHSCERCWKLLGHVFMFIHRLIF